ncbi:MAG: LysR family transcriptional regulator [bacterium]|nr:LysR family transcriptional regulator [bacterium]
MEQNLSSYRIFYSVANNGNISKAAHELYISQPAVSKAVRKLEEEVGCQLFLRSSRGVKLTDEGQILYDSVKTAFEALLSGEEKLKQHLELGIGQLRIGVSSTLCKFVLLPYLKEFIHSNPHIRISISCQSSDETLQMLEADQIDLGLVGKPDHLHQLQFDFVEEVEDIFVATEDYLHNLRLRGVDDEHFFEQSTLMLLEQSNLSRRYIDQYFLEHHLTLTDIIEVSNMDLLIDFAKIGVGIACVIRRFVDTELKKKTLIELPLPAKVPSREIGFIYHTSHARSQAMDAFITFYKCFDPINRS